MSELRAECIVKRFETGEGTLEILSEVDLSWAASSTRPRAA